jgi:Domain of unknown function (DUF4167)
VPDFVSNVAALPETCDIDQTEHVINKGPMQNNFRNSRKQRGQRQPRLRFHSSQVSQSREGAGNILANARRQYERYMALAEAAGDAVEAQNYYQHAEHFFRVMRGQEA